MCRQNGIPTPDRRVRSRPPSFAGRESPIQLRSRSSTSDSLRSGSSPNSGGGGNQSSNRNATFFPPPVTTAGSSVNTAAALMAGSTSNLSVQTSKKNNNASATTTSAAAAAAVTAANVGSLKKRAAPLPPPTTASTFTRASSQNTHSRNASDYGVSYPAQRMKPPSESHSQSRKSLVADYLDSTKTRTFHHSAAHLRMINWFFCNSKFEIICIYFFLMIAGAKLVLPKGELPQLRKLHGSATSLASTTSSNRPRGPPPPTPANVSTAVNSSKPLSRNGRSTESLSSAPSDGEFNDKPLPPARGTN